MLLTKEVEDILEKGGFEYCLYDGCFDIAAQRDFTFFLKILNNVDSFQETQATNLKIISRDFSAAIAVIGTDTRRERLKDNIIYERFDVPTFTAGTLENMLVNDLFPLLYRARGGLFADINPEKLRQNREKAGLTQAQLAEMIGVSKKNVYEHEHARKKALLEVVEKIEKTIGSVSDAAVLNFHYPDAKNIPKDVFEKMVFSDLNRIGFSADFVYQTPFNIVAKSENILLMSKADENGRRVRKGIEHVSRISELTEVPAVAVTKEEIDLDIPTVSERELRGMSKKDIRKLLK